MNAIVYEKALSKLVAAVLDKPVSATDVDADYPAALAMATDALAVRYDPTGLWDAHRDKLVRLKPGA